MHLIHEPISVEEGNAIVAELNPAIDFERYGGKPVPRWARSRMANTPVPEDDPPWYGRAPLPDDDLLSEAIHLGLARQVLSANKPATTGRYPHQQAKNSVL
jgi:hypothetical protein